jgi:outer membrane protein assembly factor BamA
MKNAKMHLSSDSSVHVFNYFAYQKGFKGFKPSISYTNEDRLFVHLGYRIQKYKWRKTPFGSQVDLGVNYSITQKALSYKFSSIYYQLIGQWNLGFTAEYDAIRDQYFAGIGNNSVLTKDRQYYFYRNREANVGLNLYRQFGLHHTITLSGYYQYIKVLEDANKFISIDATADKTLFYPDNYLGAAANYDFNTINHILFPSKGIRFSTGVNFTQNIKEKDRRVTNFSGTFGFYVPLASSLVLAVKTSGATLTGNPEIYQLNRLGGGSTLRGFSRYRFYGKSSFYNQNELQWNFNVKSYLFTGKMGLLALLDDGRVWQPGEVSDKWHTAVGGGIMLAPFNKITITTTYAKSSEDQRFNLRLGRLF